MLQSLARDAALDSEVVERALVAIAGASWIPVVHRQRDARLIQCERGHRSRVGCCNRGDAELDADIGERHGVRAARSRGIADNEVIEAGRRRDEHRCQLAPYTWSMVRTLQQKTGDA